MSKFGKRFLRRATMNSKMGNKDFYKGRGARTEGTHTTKGAFVVRPERLMKIIAPDLTGCELKPYVHTMARKLTKGNKVPDYTASAKSKETPELR